MLHCRSSDQSPMPRRPGGGVSLVWVDLFACMSHHYPRPILPLQSADSVMESDTTASTDGRAPSTSADATDTSQLDSELARKNIPGFVTKLYKYSCTKIWHF